LHTGGTIAASRKVISKLGGVIVECAFVVELPELKGRELIKEYPVFNLVEFGRGITDNKRFNTHWLTKAQQYCYKA
jgi:hypothetical protein